MTNHQLLTFFLTYRKTKGYTDTKNMKYYIHKFLTFLDEHDLALTPLTYHAVQQFQTWLLTQPLTQGTVIHIITSVRHFCSYLKQQSVLITNPFQELPPLRRTTESITAIYTEAEMSTLLSALACFEGDPARYRLHVVCELLYATGCAISELSACTEQDINFREHTIRLKTRTVFFHHYAGEILKAYVKRRSRVLHHHADPTLLFGSKSTTLQRVVNDGLKPVTTALGLPSITCSGFRHAFGFHLYRSGCQLRFIQALMGHRLLRSVEIYSRIETNTLDTMLKRCHPRGAGHE